jgi:hypothetical protein
MTIEGAIIREQGQVFAVVVVRSHVVESPAEANRAISSFMPLFPGMPVVLASQGSRGRFTYYGRPDISSFLASIDPLRIPWRKYNFS